MIFGGSRFPSRTKSGHANHMVPRINVSFSQKPRNFCVDPSSYDVVANIANTTIKLAPKPQASRVRGPISVVSVVPSHGRPHQSWNVKPNSKGRAFGGVVQGVVFCCRRPRRSARGGRQALAANFRPQLFQQRDGMTNLGLLSVRFLWDLSFDRQRPLVPDLF